MIGMMFGLALLAAGSVAAQQSSTDNLNQALTISARHMTNDGLQGVLQNDDQNMILQADQEDKDEGADRLIVDLDDVSGDDDDEGEDSPNAHQTRCP
jgi:hypothetical protein